MCFLIVDICQAKYISLTTSVTNGIIEDKMANISLNLLNGGDEAAYDVQVSLVLPDGFSSDSIFTQVLHPNEPLEGIFNITATENMIPGKYPAVVMTDYADANGYRFSTISPTSVIYRTPTVSMVSGSIPELILSGKQKKRLTVDIKNLDDIPHDVKVKLFLPRELRSDEYEKTISMKAKGEKRVDFLVSSLSALPGSNYIILVSMSYEDNNLFYSSIARGSIKIVESQLNIPSAIPITILFILLIVFIYTRVKNTTLVIKFERR